MNRDCFLCQYDCETAPLFIRLLFSNTEVMNLEPSLFPEIMPCHGAHKDHRLVTLKILGTVLFFNHKR